MNAFVQNHIFMSKIINCIQIGPALSLLEWSPFNDKDAKEKNLIILSNEPLMYNVII